MKKILLFLIIISAVGLSQTNKLNYTKQQIDSALTKAMQSRTQQQIISQIDSSLNANPKGWQNASQVRSIVGDSSNVLRGLINSGAGLDTNAVRNIAKQSALDTLEIVSIYSQEPSGSNAYAIVNISGELRRVLLQNLPTQLQVQTQIQALWDSLGRVAAGLGGVVPTNPLPVTNLTASASNQKITLNWTNPTERDSIQIRRASSLTGGTNFSLLAFVGSGTTTYVDTPLTNGTTYTYELRVFKNGFASAPVTVSATPFAPTEVPYYLTLLPTSLINFDTISVVNLPASDTTFMDAEADNQYSSYVSSGVTITRVDSAKVSGSLGYHASVTSAGGTGYLIKNIVSQGNGDTITVEMDVKIPYQYIGAGSFSNQFIPLKITNIDGSDATNEVLADIVLRASTTNPTYFRYRYRSGSASNAITTVAPTSITLTRGQTYKFKIKYMRNNDNTNCRFVFYVGTDSVGGANNVNIGNNYGTPRDARFGVVETDNGTSTVGDRLFFDNCIIRGKQGQETPTQYKYAKVTIRNDSTTSLTIRNIKTVKYPYLITWGDTTLTRINAGDTASFQIRFDNDASANFYIDSLSFQVEYLSGTNTHFQHFIVRGNSQGIPSPGGGIISASYYFDAVLGNDNNNGTTPQTAWKSVNKFNNTTFPAGSIIAFRDSMDYIGAWYLSEDGTSSDSIVITNWYGSSSQKYPRFIHSATTTLASWTQTSGYTNVWETNLTNGIYTLIFEGDSIEYGWYKSSIAAMTAEYDCFYSNGKLYVYSPQSPSLRYKNVWVSNTWGYNQTLNLEDADYVQLRYLDFAFCHYRGLLLDRADNIKVQFCNFYFNQTMYNSNFGIIGDAGNGIEILGGTNILIEDCNAWENGSHGYYVYGLPSRPTANNITFNRCVAWDNHHTIALDVNTEGGYIRNVRYMNGLTFKSSSYQRHIDVKAPYEVEDSPSFFITAQGGIGQARHIYLINNVVWQRTGVGIQLEYFCDTTYLYNNTVIIYGSDANFRVPIYRGGDADGVNQLVELKNNVFYTSTTNNRVNDCRGSQTTVIQQNNLYWRENGQNTLVTYVPMGTGDVFANPQFVNFNNFNFRLSSSSPARNTGQNLGSIFTTDILGVTRPQESVWDKGAYEYVP